MENKVSTLHYTVLEYSRAKGHNVKIRDGMVIARYAAIISRQRGIVPGKRENQWGGTEGLFFPGNNIKNGVRMVQWY